MTTFNTKNESDIKVNEIVIIKRRKGDHILVYSQM